MQENNFLIYFDIEGLLGTEYSTYSDILKKCIHINSVSIQETMDINPLVLQQIFEHYSFLEYRKNELIKLIDAVKIELKNKCMKQYPQEYYLNSKLKIENCGHVKNCYVNGYIEYCNVHKYEHQDYDHQFIYKTPNKAMLEYNVQIKYTVYQQLVTNICLKIKNYIEKVIQSQYIIVEVTPSNKVTQWLKEHPLAFKTRAKNEKNKICCYMQQEEKSSFLSIQ